MFDERWRALDVVEREYAAFREEVNLARGKFLYWKAIDCVNGGQARLGRRLLIEHQKYGYRGEKWMQWWAYSWVKKLRRKIWPRSSDQRRRGASGE